jgi:hypothetical protein
LLPKLFIRTQTPQPFDGNQSGNFQKKIKVLDRLNKVIYPVNRLLPQAMRACLW